MVPHIYFSDTIFLPTKSIHASQGKHIHHFLCTSENLIFIKTLLLFISVTTYIGHTYLHHSNNFQDNKSWVTKSLNLNNIKTAEELAISKRFFISFKTPTKTCYLCQNPSPQPWRYRCENPAALFYISIENLLKTCYLRRGVLGGLYRLWYCCLG